MNARRHDRGTVLIVAVIAMLVLGVLSFSFALLSRVEVTTGVNYKAQAQAEALAEAGLEHGRDAVRGATRERCGFTPWTDPGNASSYGCGSGLTKLLFDGVGLGAGDYSAVIDNDCSPLVPAAIQDASCGGASPTRDTNETAVLTAWATVANGQGRARVRAIVGIDSAWRHICSNSSQDYSPGYCNEPANRNGSPAVVPGDPNEYPGGPAAYDDLPRPQLGCSAIDPTLHGETAASCPPGQTYGYPYPSGKRLVVAGDRSKANCDAGGETYQGFFDCALSTPCSPSICGGSGRSACVKASDSRIHPDFVRATAPGVCGAAGATGMVFRGAPPPDASYGAPGAGVLVYVMRGTVAPWTSAGCCDFTLQANDFHGTVVIEGNGQPGCSGSNRDLVHRNGVRIWTQPNVYGYPLAYLIFDPVEAVAAAPEPTANPLDPQETCADVGGAPGTAVHGIVYSGGNVEFNEAVVDGGVVAFQIQTQAGSSSYRYNPTYGQAAPPPGFAAGVGGPVVLVRKSFMVCADYAADTGGGSPCR
jgi:Tfp pilus assembly protein PilX